MNTEIVLAACVVALAYLYGIVWGMREHIRRIHAYIHNQAITEVNHNGREDT